MIRKDEVVQNLAYLLTAVVSVGIAFVVSLKFVGRTNALTPPPTVPAPTAAPALPAGAAATAPAPSDDLGDLQGFLEPFIYDTSNRRDPFMPYLEYLPSVAKPQSGLTLAQRFSLNQLQLVGIMWDIRNPKAMFMDPDQDVIVLGRDESIGDRNGYIAAIREGEVVVVETIRKRGNVSYRTRVLRLQR